ncbi:MAG: AMP-binding protein [Chloroflexi bacterium]|nr:AMP-binding protein [Chloroflexota bacterium]
MRKTSDVPLHYNAVDILERNLEERADKIALYSPERAMTFREVSNEVNQVGRALLKLGLRFGDIVGILSVDCPEWAASFFGIVKIGGVAIGMNTMLTTRECDYILRDSRARALIVHESLLPSIEQVREGLPFLEHVIVIGRPARPGDLPYRNWIGDRPVELEAAPTTAMTTAC